jgi:hypothetical protein
MKKIIITIMAILVLGTASYAEKPYVKLGVSQLKMDFKTIDGIDYGSVYADKYDVYNLTGGFEFDNNFFVEARYFWTSEESKSGSATAGDVSISGSTKVDMDGYSIGGGYNYKVNEKFSVRPSIHYVDIDVNSTVNLTIEESSGTFDTGGSDQLLEAGMELAYAINDNSNISFIYTRYLDDMGTAEDINTMGISYKHNF